MSLACFQKWSLGSLNSKLLASGVISIHQILQQRSAIGLATADSDIVNQRQLLIQSTQDRSRLSRLQHLFWQTLERNKSEAESQSLGSNRLSAESLVAHFPQPKIAWWIGCLARLCEAFKSLPAPHWEQTLHGSWRERSDKLSLGASLQSHLSLAWVGGLYHNEAVIGANCYHHWVAPPEILSKGNVAGAHKHVADIETISTSNWVRGASLFSAEEARELDLEAYWRGLDSQPQVDVPQDESAAPPGCLDPGSPDLPDSSDQSELPSTSADDGIRGEEQAIKGGSRMANGVIGGTPEQSGGGMNSDEERKPSGGRQSSIFSSATTVKEVIDIVMTRQHMDFFFASDALYHCAVHFGVKKSERLNRRGNYRPAMFYDRQILKKSPAFRRLIASVVKERQKAKMSNLVSLLWALSALRFTGSARETPTCIRLLAEELETRGSNGSFELVPPHQLGMIAYGLHNNMREDVPWPRLLQLLVNGLVLNRDETLAGPASSMLKSVGTYKIVFGTQPVSEDAMAFLIESLSFADPYSPGPQALSQGLYSLAKLGHKAGELPGGWDVAPLAESVLERNDKDNPHHRQAIANTFWALAELDFPMSTTFYRKIMLLIQSHSYHFLHMHFGQVFHALRKYGFKLTTEQVEVFGRAVMICLPRSPEKDHIIRWQGIIPDLKELVRNLKLSNQKVPLAIVEAISALEHVNDDPRKRLQTRRNVLKRVFPEKRDPVDVAKAAEKAQRSSRTQFDNIAMFKISSR